MSADTRTDPPTPDPLNFATVERSVGPWRRSSHSFAEGSPPHRQREETRARLDPIWADPDRLVLLAVNDYDGCYAIATLPSAPDQRLREALEQIADWEGTKTAPHGGFDFDAHHDCTVKDCPAMMARATLSEATPSPEATLDVAWREAEAALPEGSWLYLAKTSKGRYGAQVRGGKPTGASGSTPTAALQALAARLRGPA